MMEPGPGQPPLELALAQRANDAISKGADPQAVTQRLHDVLAHLRSNPDVAGDASDALTQGIDPDAIGRRVYEHSQLHAPASRAQADQTVVNPNDNPSLLKRAGQVALSAITAPAESFGKLISPPESEVADLNSESNPSRQALEARYGFAPTFKSVTPSERAWAGAQTAANVAAPFLAKFGAAGAIAAGAAGGAAYSPKDPAKGALMGSFINSMLHVIPEAGSAAVDAYKAAPGAPSSRTVNLVLKSLERDNASIPMLRSTRAMLPENAPVALPDIAGQNTITRAQSAVTVPGTAREEIPAALAERRQLQPGRVASQVDQALGTTGKNYFSERQNLVNTLRTEDSQNYAKAEAHGAVNDPGINAILETPAFAKAFKAVQAMRGADNPLPTAAQRVTKPLVVDGRTILDESTGQPRTYTTTEQTAVPDVEALHDVKMLIDQAIDKKGHFNDDLLKNVGLDRKIARQLIAKKNDFLTAFDNAVPDYAAARSNSAGLRSQIRAGSEGRDFAKMEPEEMAASMDQVAKTPDQQAQYRVGAARTIKGQLAKVQPTGQAAPNVPSLADNTLAQARLARLATSPSAFDQLMQNTAMERVFNQTQKGITAGSNTTDKALAASELMQPGVSRLIMQGAGGRYGKLAQSFMQKFINQRMMDRASTTAGELSPLYTAGMTGPNPRNALEQVLKMLEDAKRPPKYNASAKTLFGPSVVAGDNEQRQ